MLTGMSLYILSVIFPLITNYKLKRIELRNRKRNKNEDRIKE